MRKSSSSNNSGVKVNAKQREPSGECCDLSLWDNPHCWPGFSYFYVRCFIEFAHLQLMVPLLSR